MLDLGRGEAEEGAGGRCHGPSFPENAISDYPCAYANPPRDLRWGVFLSRNGSRKVTARRPRDPGGAAICHARIATCETKLSIYSGYMGQLGAGYEFGSAPLPPTGDPEQLGAGVIEVNAVPGLRMHLAPVRGRSRDVGDAIVRAMFPGGSDGRIPTVDQMGERPDRYFPYRFGLSVWQYVGARWGDVCILNLSKRGMLVQAPEAPERGTYLEVRRGSKEIVARVVWSAGNRFGAYGMEVWRRVHGDETTRLAAKTWKGEWWKYGGGGTVKVGTKVKNIRLVDSDHDIDCKIEGFGAMSLKTEFVKKVV